MSEKGRVLSVFGVAAEYDSAEALTAAARRVTEQGYRHIEAYTPFSVEALSGIIPQPVWPVALSTLIAGMIGGATGFGMCWFANVINYPIQIGGRPNNSWPAWIPITFELTVLFAALTAAIGMIVMNGLPRLHHPMFDVQDFERASRDRFFLCIEARDPLFDTRRAHELLAQTGPLRIQEVPG